VTPLPAALGGHEFVVWRLDESKRGTAWDSGEGARLFGGRWNSRGRRAVYCCVDPATAILELAVHKGFAALDIVPHVLTAAHIPDPAIARVVLPNDVPNANWLRPGDPSAGQQAFGDGLLADHPFVLIPSVVSIHSWNVLFDPEVARGLYVRQAQEPFALDPKLHPPAY
jgi:RES domain-containing protein